MANSGRGSVKKLPNGRYKARIRPPGGGNEIAKTFDRKGDADDWLDDKRNEFRQGTYVDAATARMTFGAWVETWTAAQLHTKASTRAAHANKMGCHILPTFRDRPIGAITRAEVQSWVRGLTATLAPRTVHVVYGLFSQVMTAAADEPVIPRSPCRKISLPPVPDHDLVIPLVEQLELVEAGLPAPYRRIVAVGAGTGLRLGEALGLTEDRVDLVRGTVRVNRQLGPRGPGFVPPKSPKSTRTIPIGQHTVGVLAAQLREFPPGRGGLVFRSTKGGHLARQSWDNAWHRALERAERAADERGLDLPPFEGLTAHSWRHYYASLLIRQGLSVAAVAAVLGHDNIRTTLETYTHLWPDDSDRVRKAVDEVLLADEDETDKSGDAAAGGGTG